MKHADRLMERIFMLDGLPNLQDLGKLLIGENVPELLSCDLQSETGAQATIKDGIAHCESVRDFVSRDILQDILDDTEEHIDWLETQIDLSPRSGSRTTCNRRWASPTDAGRAPSKGLSAMIVCVCRRVSDHEIRRAAARRRGQPRVPAVRARRRDAVRPLRRLRDARALRCARAATAPAVAAHRQAEQTA